MIVASRIPALAERMRAVTIRAAAEQQPGPAGPIGPVEADPAPERAKATLERLAA